MTTSTSTTGRPAAAQRRRLAPGTRRAVLVVHILASVALLGASASILLLGVSGATTDDPELAKAAFQFASTSGMAFGIPLSFTALISGLVLALRGKWGLLRYPWVTIKLGLLIATILSGALVIGPSADRLMDDPTGSATVLIAGAVFNVAALVTSTALSVYRPGKRRETSRGRAAATA
jgi:hypothetical protein